MRHIVKIKSIENITLGIVKFVTEKPHDYSFIPGQSTKVSVNKWMWENEKRSFTFTSLPDNDYLEFFINSCPLHQNVTNKLLKLKQGDELIVHEVFGGITYKFEGVFIAESIGITAFISIFRDLARKNKMDNNKLIFVNKTKADILLEEEFKKLLGKNFINILSEEMVEGYAHGKITQEFIKANIDTINQNFYLCGPQAMVKTVETQLENLNVYKDYIVRELL